VTSINGGLGISDNQTLTSLIGLDNIEAGSIDDLYINNNNLLSTCEVQSICEYLASPNGTIYIQDNAPGCMNLYEVAINCDSSLCLIDGYTFTTQAQIDSFPILNPYCEGTAGSVMIMGADINNLNGLNGLTSFGGDLTILNNDNLTNLSGLENITSIGGQLIVQGNEILSSLTGLENAILINGDLYIGGGLNASYGNPSLSNLSGLNSLEASSIDNLYIGFNYSLPDCDVQSICDYLANPNGIIEIHDNADGCNSLQQVQDDCDSMTAMQEPISYKTYSISPNPSSGIVNIQIRIKEQGLVAIEIFEISGIRIKRLSPEVMMPGTYDMEIDLSDLPKGIYFCVLKTNAEIQTRKIIKL